MTVVGTPVAPASVNVEPSPLISGGVSDQAITAGGGLAALGTSSSLGELLPGMTTFIILVTFAMTLFQLYKYV